MKKILELDVVIRELSISAESFALWKAANLGNPEEASSTAWPGTDQEGNYQNSVYFNPGDLKTS